MDQLEQVIGGGPLEHGGNEEKISHANERGTKRKREEAEGIQDGGESNLEDTDEGTQEEVETYAMYEVNEDVEARAWEMERRLQVTAKSLDSSGCLSKLLCYLKHHPRLPEDLLLLQIFTGHLTSRDDCRGSFPRCPLKETQLTTLFRNSWKGSNHLL